MLALSLLSCRLAHAQPDSQASEFFRAGEAAYVRGDFPAAARAFEEAHRRAPHAATLYNAGLAWQWANQSARAADDYEAALRMDGLNPQQKRDASERLAALEKRLGHIRVLASPRAGVVSVGHVERAPAPLTVHALPGRHEVRLIRPGGEIELTAVTVIEGATEEVTFTAPSLPATSVVAGASAEGPAMSSARPWAWIALGTSVAALGSGAIYTGVAALDARDKYNASARTDLGAYDRATTLRTLTNVLWAGTALVAATGAFFMFSSSGTDASAGPSGRVSTMLAVGPGGALLTTSF
ncbi:MAG TPA: tetratricopeptide repeat protein [Polyangia bacterium]